MTIAEQWRDEGMQQGMQKGEAIMLVRLISRRFGDIPAPFIQQITKADPQTLLLWGDKVLQAANLEEIFADSNEE